mmetsp:Transcript_17069/g.34634  ORF Transcript_17069/g.34634 Transcript_17069/m.34634 type:complete len:403 (+) Transcript_17069:48-1256(+)
MHEETNVFRTHGSMHTYTYSRLSPVVRVVGHVLPRQIRPHNPGCPSAPQSKIDGDDHGTVMNRKVGLVPSRLAWSVQGRVLHVLRQFCLQLRTQIKRAVRVHKAVSDTYAHLFQLCPRSSIRLLPVTLFGRAHLTNCTSDCRGQTADVRVVARNSRLEERRVYHGLPYCSCLFIVSTTFHIHLDDVLYPLPVSHHVPRQLNTDLLQGLRNSNHHLLPPCPWNFLLPGGEEDERIRCRLVTVNGGTVETGVASLLKHRLHLLPFQVGVRHYECQHGGHIGFDHSCPLCSPTEKHFLPAPHVHLPRRGLRVIVRSHNSFRKIGKFGGGLRGGRERLDERRHGVNHLIDRQLPPNHPCRAWNDFVSLCGRLQTRRRAIERRRSLFLALSWGKGFSEHFTETFRVA